MYVGSLVGEKIKFIKAPLRLIGASLCKGEAERDVSGRTKSTGSITIYAVMSNTISTCNSLTRRQEMERSGKEQVMYKNFHSSTA